MAHDTSQEVLKRRLTAGALRLRLNDALGWASWGALAAVGGMFLLLLLQRIAYLDMPIESPLATEKADLGLMAYYMQKVLASLSLPGWALLIMLGLIFTPLLVGAAGFLASRKGILAAAITADERLGLRARLSSAVAMDPDSTRSPMAPALFSDAERHAAALSVGRDFPVLTPPQATWALFSFAVLILMTLFLPQADVFGREERIRRKNKEKEDVRLAARTIEDELKKALKRKPQRKRTAGKELPSQKLDDELSQLVKDMKEAADRDQAITKLNKLLDKAKLTEARMASMGEMLRRMQNMKKQGADADLPKGAGRKLGQAMMAGDFKKAAEELKKLQDKLKDKKLSDEEKADMKRDLEKLAKMTDDWKELAEQLQKAADKMGEDDGLEAMQEALEGLEELAKLLKDLGMEAGEGEGLAGEGQQIQLTKEMIEQLKKMLKNAQRCAKCKKLYCLSCSKPRCACDALEQCSCQAGNGQCDMIQLPGMGGGAGGAGGAGGKGSGMGGMGQGEGGIAPEEKHDVKFTSTKIKGKMGRGRIISHMFVKGRPSVTDDEKKTEYKTAHHAAAKAASEEVNSGRIPRELREYVRDYFSSTDPKKKSK
jgi:hypothetical protein